MLFRKKKKDVIEAPQPVDLSHLERQMMFDVAGVTFDNEDGTDRQDIIKGIRNELVSDCERSDLYGGYTAKEIKEDDVEITETDGLDFGVDFRMYEFKGAPAVYVLYDDQIIGNVPKEDVPRFLQLLAESSSCTATAYLTGGKMKRLNWESDKVETIELTYGCEVFVKFS